MSISSQTRAEIQGLVKQMAPGLHLKFDDNPAFDSTTISLELLLQNKRLVSNHEAAASNGEAVALRVASMLAEIQKEAVKAIGLEAYVREREVAVLELVREKILHPVQGENPDPFDQVRNELGAP